ncbi:MULTISPECIES: hypothetical protein [Mycobacterium]|uniref:hypothetical protein n=1 Tax=Mycobacterium gordonae TaxID=1778 RepID=UPI000AE02CC1|nr:MULTISPECIES: hypothetical protein [Mycobacterium]
MAVDLALTDARRQRGHRLGSWIRRLPIPGCAIVDRLTFGGNIIETGTDSYRLAHTKTARAR